MLFLQIHNNLVSGEVQEGSGVTTSVIWREPTTKKHILKRLQMELQSFRLWLSESTDTNTHPP